MADKILFPQYWVSLKEEVILENIKYLDAHLNQYDIKLDGCWLKLHKDKDYYDIDITFYDIVQHEQKIHVAKVNGKIMRCDKYPELYNRIKALYDKCNKETNSLQTKVKNKKKDNKKRIFRALVLGTCVIVFEAGLIFFMNRKQDREKQEKVEFAKELLNAYEAERANGTVNMDSLINSHIK